jgi:hypothetical protein
MEEAGRERDMAAEDLGVATKVRPTVSLYPQPIYCFSVNVCDVLM